MNKEEPKVLTRMRLSCCWGDNLNEKELNEVVDYINLLQQKVNQLETNIDEAIELLIEDIDFLENDSVGKYYVCDESVDREKKALEILKGGSNE